MSYLSSFGNRLSHLTLSELIAVVGDKVPPPPINPSFLDRIFNQEETFWLFLSQILSATQSCGEALKKAQMWLSSSNKKKLSSSTSGYCQARSRLSPDYLETVDHQVRNELKTKGRIPSGHLWCGRPVKVVDGTSVSMPDTPENQELYPQPKGQKKGCGFPVMRLVVSFCLATGILLSCRKGSLHVHERILWHQMWVDYEEGDVVLADCGFCAFVDYWLLANRGVDSVMRLHQMRKEKVIIKRFNKNDRLVQWKKNKKPNWITREKWEDIPEEMTVRHVTVNVDIPGFRTKNFVLATTLLDGKKYPREALAELYLRRWKVEIFIRDIKTTMRMDILRCKTPNMVHKELTLFIIAYNLIRILIWEAVLEKDVDPFRISVAGTINIIRQWAPKLADTEEENERERLIKIMMEFIAAEIIPERVYRKRQARALKRRMKSYQLLTKPRNEFMEIEHRHKYRKNVASS
jgi:hypothetical protein